MMDETSATLKANVAAQIGQIRSNLVKGNSVKLRIINATMRPTIQPNDVVKIIPCEPKSLLPGEVVLVILNDELLPRRVISKDYNGSGVSLILTVKGDALPENDPPRPEKMVLGKITEAERKGHVIRIRRDTSLIPKEQQKGGFLQKLFFWKKK